MKNVQVVKAHAGTPKVTLHIVHLKNLASYTGPKRKATLLVHAKTDNFVFSYSNLKSCLSKRSYMNRKTTAYTI